MGALSHNLGNDLQEQLLHLRKFSINYQSLHYYQYMFFPYLN